jgi:hypothetical protein
VGPGDVLRWDAHAVRHSSDPSGMAVVPTGRPCGAGAGRRLTGGLARYTQHIFLFIQMFSNGFKFEPVKRWPSMLKNFQIKYGIVGN